MLNNQKRDANNSHVIQAVISTVLPIPKTGIKLVTVDTRDMPFLNRGEPLFNPCSSAASVNAALNMSTGI